VRLSDVDTRELAGFQNELICHFMLAADVVGGGIWEFYEYRGRTSIPGKGAGGIMCGWVPVSQEFTTVPINMFREYLTCFPNVKSFTFFTLELVYQVGGFAICKSGDGISEAGVGAGERLGGDVDGTHLAGRSAG
jgi:hypothetical protein